ncbi:uncharacterized protein VTP21DRAFT_2151 [Calcarisporiella thermophila]|uniref:uncharacterized protein n=1 Tax=Calcarisporiella thermophila TaxID=911321 RepID=UPI003742BC48
MPDSPRRSEEILLQNTNVSDEERGFLEEEGPSVPTKHEKKERQRVLIILFSLSSILLIAVLSAFFYAQGTTVPSKRNVILMISDGMGPASMTFARSYYQYVNNKTYDYELPLDTILVGSSRSRSASSLVTDSAAGATAFSCGLKTINRRVAMDVQNIPCGTVLESAKAHGLATGLVATSRITHATPASFSAHVTERDNEAEIASQQIGNNALGRVVDVMLGGGRCFFLPNNNSESCRKDDRDLIHEARDRGFQVLLSRPEFDAANPAQVPILGLFAPGHMDYEIDRVPKEQPSLYEMAQKALEILTTATEKSDKGFFLMIEGSRIDMAAHSNDPGAHLHDILHYNEVAALVKDYVEKHPGTVMISVSDHETGGLTLARQLTTTYPEYLWYPDVLTRVHNSTYKAGERLAAYNGPDRIEYLHREILNNTLGIVDPLPAELANVEKKHSAKDYNAFLATMLSKRAQVGWTTKGHSGVDVNLYAYGTEHEKLVGAHDNTYIGKFIEEFLELDLDAITDRLNKENATFHAASHHKEIDLLSFTTDLPRYHEGILQ